MIAFLKGNSKIGLQQVGSIKSSSTISFELHDKMAEEIDLENCNFRDSRSPVTLTLTLNRVEVKLIGISGRGTDLQSTRSKGKINSGRHTDHPAGRHSIRTNQCPPPPSPIFYGPDALPAAQPTASKTEGK